MNNVKLPRLVSDWQIYDSNKLVEKLGLVEADSVPDFWNMFENVVTKIRDDALPYKEITW